MSQAAASVLALVLAGVAGAALTGRPDSVLDRLAPVRGAGPAGARRWAVVTAAAALLVLLKAGAVPVLVVVALGSVGLREVRRRGTDRLAARHRAALGEVLAALTAELRSGAEPRPALAAAASGVAGMEQVVVAAAQQAGDVHGALRELAARPGTAVAADLAAAWRVAELTGCGLAAPVSQILHGHRAQQRVRREVTAELAGPTATAYLLAALPLAGVALGAALGADPLRFLLVSAAGRLCLTTGVLLVVAGIAWTRAITRSVAVPGTGDP